MGILDTLFGDAPKAPVKTETTKSESDKTESPIIEAVKRAIVGKVERKQGMSYFVDKEGNVCEHKLGGRKKKT